MARKKNIARGDILLAAYRAWTTRGYAGSGLRELAAESGFSLASLLHRFGSKELLMAETLAMAREAWNAAMARLNAQDLPWPQRQAALQAVLAADTPEGALLLTTAAAEFPALPQALQGAAREYCGTVAGWVSRLLSEAKKRGEWTGQDPAEGAWEAIGAAHTAILRRRLGMG